MQWTPASDNRPWPQQHAQRPWSADTYNDPRYQQGPSHEHGWPVEVPRPREPVYAHYEQHPGSAPRPAITHAYTYPPNQAQGPPHYPHPQRPLSSGNAGGHTGHPHGYQPYAAAAAAHPKKPLLFINSAPSGQDPSLSKPKRKRIMPEQLVELCALFDVTDSPSFEAREKVGNAVGMTNREVQVWFQNRRAKVLREQALSKESKSPAKESSKPKRDEPPPLSTFTSRFATGREEEASPEQRWAYLPTAPPTADGSEDSASAGASVPPPAAVTPIEMAPPAVTVPPAPISNGLVAAAPAQAPMRGQPSTSHHREIFQRVGHSLEMPSPQFPATQPPSAPSLPPGSVAAGYRSPTFLGYSPGTHFTSPFFGAPSPSLSSAYSMGGSLFSPHPGSSSYSSPSSYFSHPDSGSGLYSPSFASPGSTGASSNLFRLTLDSPGVGGSSPRSVFSHQFDRSPGGGYGGPQSWDPLNRLPPIVSPVWDPTLQQLERDRARATQQLQQQQQQQGSPRPQGHQRSQSDQTSERNGAAGEHGTATNRRSLSPSSTPAEPETETFAHPQQPRAYSYPRPQHARTLSKLSNMSQSLPQTMEEDQEESSEEEAEAEAVPLHAPRPQSAGVGLGMLAMAGEMVEVVDDREKAALERYMATRKLSMAAAAAGSQT